MGYLELAKLAGVFVLVAAIFGGGYKVGYNVEHAKVLSMQVAIEKANNEAAEILARQTQKILNAEKKARKLNNELVKTHEKDTKTINDFRDANATLKLRDPNKHKTSCSRTVPTGSGSGSVNADAGDDTELSNELARLLRAETYRADQTAVEKNALLKFVKSNCGISK